MKLLRFYNLTNSTKAAALAVSCAFAISCTKGGGGITGGGSGGSSISGSITLSATYPTAAGNTWTPITSGSRIYIKGLALTVEGVCSRGIATIKVNEGGSNYAEVGTCASDGSFVFSKTYTAVTGEGDKTLTFTAYDADGLLITGATASEEVRIDNTAPAVPVVTAPATTPYSHNGAVGQYTIMGTCASDVDHMTGPGGVTIACSSNAWSYNATLTSGATLNFTFYTWDLAGNQSAGVTQQILWSPTVIMYAAGPQSGGIIADSSVANYTLEASQSAMSATESDVFTNFSLTTGFNYIINLVRGL